MPDNEIQLVLTDWFNVDSIQLAATNPFNFAGTNTFLGTANYHCRDENKAYQHGVKVSSLCMDSLVVNGFGQYRNHFNASDAFSSIKQTYTIPSDTTNIKVRTIHAGLEFPIRMFRLDGKSITVGGTDGADILPIEVTELIVGIGETFDVHLEILQSVKVFHLILTVIMTRFIKPYY